MLCSILPKRVNAITHCWHIVDGKKIVLAAARAASEHGCPELLRRETVLENDRLVVMERV